MKMACAALAPARYRGGRPPPGTEATLCNTGARRQVQRRRAPAARYRGDGLPSPCDREGNNGIRRDEDDEGAFIASPWPSEMACAALAPARYRGGRPPPGTEATLCGTVLHRRPPGTEADARRQVQRRRCATPAPAARYRGDRLPPPGTEATGCHLRATAKETMVFVGMRMTRVPGV